MSKWRYGCDKPMTVYLPRGYGYLARTVRCGSTAHDGGVNQCDDCRAKRAMPPAYEDESDLDYDERVNGGGDDRGQ